MSNLRITSGDNIGKYFPLANRPVSIRRDPARDIQFTDLKVSRKQCMIQRRGDECLMRPFESINAVLINGEEILDEAVLNEGNEIQLGDTTLRFCAAEDPDRTNALEQHQTGDTAAAVETPTRAIALLQADSADAAGCEQRLAEYQAALTTHSAGVPTGDRL